MFTDELGFPFFYFYRWSILSSGCSAILQGPQNLSFSSWTRHDLPEDGAGACLSNLDQHYGYWGVSIVSTVACSCDWLYYKQNKRQNEFYKQFPPKETNVALGELPAGKTEDGKPIIRRGLVADRDIAEGEVIYQESAFVSALHPDLEVRNERFL